MPNYIKRAEFAAMGSIAFGSISGTYANLGSAFEYPVVLLEITNLTDQPMIVSDDDDVAAGKVVVPSNGSKTYDIRTNHAKEPGFAMAAQTQMVVKTGGSNPSTGSVYLTLIYGL